MVSFDAALAVFLLVTITMFVVVVLIFNVWAYVLVFYFVTLCMLGGIHVAQLNSSSRVHSGDRTVYSSRMDVGRNSRTEEAERELRRRIEREFDGKSVYDNAEDMT